MRVVMPPSEGRRGRLAPRLIQDFLSADLNHDDSGQQNGQNPLFQPCTQLRHPSRTVQATAGPDHELLCIISQCFEDVNSPVISCMCRYCRYHFVFKVEGNDTVTLGDHHLLHHYILSHLESYDDVGVTNSEFPDWKLYPVISRARYQCSACFQSVTVEMTVPRMLPKWIDLIDDEQRILDNIRNAKLEDPERYNTITDQWATTALSTLNAYVRNMLNARSGEQKQISVRNKRFYVQFGDVCDDMFQYLGFAKRPDEQDDSEEKWNIPILEYEDKTRLESPRAFYEDFRSEVQSLLDEKSNQADSTVRVDAPAQAPLEKALQCEDRTYRTSTGKNPNDLPEDFKTLGTTEDSDPKLLQYAYDCQIQTDPSNKQAYLNALKRLVIAGDQQNRRWELAEFVATQESVVEQETKLLITKNTSGTVSTGDPSLDTAYRYFGLDPGCSESDDFIIRKYNVFREQSPAQKHEHRAMLQRIAVARNSQMMRDVVNIPMPAEEACAFLGVELGNDMETIAVLAEAMVSSEGKDRQMTVLAMEAISRERHADDPNRATFEAILANIRAPTDISITVKPDASNEDADRLNVELPVGLENLRNTCYLNSILQYFYSVTAVRDLALNSNQPELEPTQEYMKRLLSAMDAGDLEPGRAFVGNEFARELQGLFYHLQSSPTTFVKPRQRLANAALLRPDRSRPAPEKPKQEDTSQSKRELPPLPPRSSNAVAASGGIGPKVTVDAVLDNSETASNVSSQTLVNQPEEEPSTYVVVGHGDQKTNGMPIDTEMVDMGKKATSEHHGAAVEGQDAQDSKLTVGELAGELDKDNVGSDQMDVDEVMGNTFDHLRAAFRISRGSGSADRDPIEAAFFTKFVDYRKKLGETDWGRTSRSDRWVTAYPAENGSRDLYEALDQSFNLEVIVSSDSDLLNFTAIEEPAPNFHVYIQRSAGRTKNSNTIVIPDTLYLDRYMDSNPNQQSRLFSLKKRSWALKTRLGEIENPLSRPDFQAGPTDASQSNPQTATTSSGTPTLEDSSDQYTFIDELELGWSIINPPVPEIFEKHKVPNPGDTPNPDSIVQAQLPVKPRSLDGARVLDDLLREFETSESDQKKSLNDERDTLFGGMEQVKYRLHAVICHMGSTATAGHYWVWIHDFKKDVWRKYNDSRVSEHSAADVFGQLNKGGEPYYLAYVRDDSIDELVSIPVRVVPNAEQQQIQNAGPDDKQLLPPAYADVEMLDFAEDMPETIHVEQAEG